MEDYLQALIDKARNKLTAKTNNGQPAVCREDYKKYLQKIADRKCPECGVEMELINLVVKSHDNADSVYYEFACGHNLHEVNVSEGIKVWEKVKIKAREENNKPHLKSLNKTEPGINPKSVDGVEISWTADRKNNIWKHKIKDIKTGKILHDEDMPLDQHK